MEVFKTRYLGKKNKSVEDDMIDFQEENHVYNVKSEYFPNEILNKYYGSKSLPLKSVTETVGGYFNSSFDSIALTVWNNLENRVLMANDPTYKYYGCTSPADIKAIWGKGAELGTKMHGHFEDLANLYEYAVDHPEDFAFKEYVDHHMRDYDEFKYFKLFCKKFGIESGLRSFYRTEMCLFHPELNISGMIDGVVYNNKLKGYEIIDYKRCKGGVKKLPQNPRKRVEDLAVNSRGKHLPSLMRSRNLPIVKYGIQLSIYRYMFERMFPGKKIIGLYLIVVDSEKIPNDNAMEIIEIPLEQHNQNILEIFQDRANNIIVECGDKLPDELFQELLHILPKPTEYDNDDENMNED